MAVMKIKQGDQWINIPSIMGAPGPQGPQGETGNSGVHVGSTEPTDPDVNVWVNPDGEGTTLLKGDRGDTVIIAKDYADLTFPVYAGKTYCYHDNKPYVAKIDIATTEAWTVAHWDEVSFEDEIGDLRSATDYSIENLFNVDSSYTATIVIGTIDLQTGLPIGAYHKTAMTAYAQSIRNPLALVLKNDAWRVAVYWYKGVEDNNEYLGRTTFWESQYSKINFDYESKRLGFYGIAKNVKIVFFRWNGTSIYTDGDDISNEEISTFASNYEFQNLQLVSDSVISAGKEKTNILIASSDAPDIIKKYADYICTGTNDELIIQEAVTQAGINNKNVLLSCGNYYIDSFPFQDVSGINIAIVIGMGTSARTSVSVLEICGCAYGNIRKYGTDTDFYRGTIFNVRQTAYEQLDNNTQYAIFACISDISGTRIYPGFKISIRNVAFKLAGNQKKIICIDGWNATALSLNNIACMAITVTSGSTSGNIAPEDLVVAVEGCIGIRGLQGSCYGINNVWENVFVWGFYIGIHVIGEHIVGIALGARFCNYGYVFGAIGDSWVGTLAHPNTLINCCDELNFNLPLFGKGGRASATGKQSVSLIDFNMEWFDDYAALGGDLAKEIVPGCAFGDITFSSVRYYGTSYPNAPFWADGHGHNFNTRNTLHAQGGTTALRQTYIPMYMQKYYDTDLNKMLIYDGANWRDANGTTIS